MTHIDVDSGTKCAVSTWKTARVKRGTSESMDGVDPKESEARAASETKTMMKELHATGAKTLLSKSMTVETGRKATRCDDGDEPREETGHSIESKSLKLGESPHGLQNERSLMLTSRQTQRICT